MIESIEKLRELANNVRNANCDTSPAIVAQFITANAYNIEREIEQKYMLLPVDADGEPIRMGDMMESTHSVNGGGKLRGFVVGLVIGDAENIVSLDTEKGQMDFAFAIVHHVKPDPYVLLLEEFEDRLRDMPYTDSDKRAHLFSETAERFKELGKAGA